MHPLTHTRLRAAYGMAAAADDEATPGVRMPPQSRSRRPEQLKTLVQLLEVALERKPTITFGELATMVADVGPVVRVRGDPWSEDLSFWDGVVPSGKRDTQVSPQTLKQAVDGFRREIHRLELVRVVSINAPCPSDGLCSQVHLNAR